MQLRANSYKWNDSMILIIALMYSCPKKRLFCLPNDDSICGILILLLNSIVYWCFGKTLVKLFKPQLKFSLRLNAKTFMFVLSKRFTEKGFLHEMFREVAKFSWFHSY